MNDLNEVIVEGKLVKDPELKWVGKKAVCSFTIAVNKNYKDRETNQYIQDTSYFLIETWNGVATSCSKYLKKGRACRLVGELKQSIYQDKNSSKLKEKVYIIAEHVEFKPENKSEIIKCKTQEIDELDSVVAREELDKDAADKDNT